MKAICKEPSSRYSTAQELADDLTRFCEDRPIQARRPTVLERGFRWGRRHRQIVVTAVTVLGLAVAVGTVLIGMQIRETNLQIQKTNTISQERLDYIRASFPLVDQIMMKYMGEKSNESVPIRVPGQWRPDPALEVYEKALKFYKQASEIPAADIESRKIVARSFGQMGFTRAVSWYRKQGNPTPDLPGLLAQAEADYRHSIELFEQLLAERPRDPEVKSWFAASLGEWGLGWFLEATRKPGESESCFRRAIQLSRDLVLDPSVDQPTRAFELDRIGKNTATLARMLMTSGRTSEAEEPMRELAELAKQQTQPETRRALVAQIGGYGLSLLQQNKRKDAADIFRLAVSVEPENAHFLNNLAWALASFADAPSFDPAEALEAARKAVSLEPKNRLLWNTMGVAAYRGGDWKTASEALEKSMSMNKGGDPNDWFFLAMTRWRQSNKAEARKWYDQAVAWMRKNKSDNLELKHFEKEAALLLESGTPPCESKPAAKG